MSFTCPLTELKVIILTKLWVLRRVAQNQSKVKNISLDLCLCAHLVDNPASDTHAVENGHVDDGGHSSIVDGLRAVRPHVRTLRQVDVAGRQTGRRRQRILLNSCLSNKSKESTDNYFCSNMLITKSLSIFLDDDYVS